MQNVSKILERHGGVNYDNEHYYSHSTATINISCSVPQSAGAAIHHSSFSYDDGLRIRRIYLRHNTARRIYFYKL